MAAERFKLTLPVGPSQLPAVSGSRHSGQTLGSEPRAPQTFLLRILAQTPPEIRGCCVRQTPEFRDPVGPESCPRSDLASPNVSPPVPGGVVGAPKLSPE